MSRYTSLAATLATIGALTVVMTARSIKALLDALEAADDIPWDDPSFDEF